MYIYIYATEAPSWPNALNGSGGSRGCDSCHRNGSCLPRNASLKSESFLLQHHQHQRRLQVADQKHGSKSSRVRHLRCKKKEESMSKRNSRTYWPGDKQRGKNRTWPLQWLEIHGNPYENLTREPAPSQPSCWLLQHQASHEVKGNTACHIWTSTLVQTSSSFPKSSKTLSGPSWGQTSRCASCDARHGNHTEASCGCRQQHAQLARSSSRSPLFVLAMWLQSNSPLKHSQNTTQQANMATAKTMRTDPSWPSPPARASKPCQSQRPQQVGLILRSLCRAACSTSASSKVTMPQLRLISTWPLSILSITNDQNHAMGVADAMDTIDTMKHEFLIRCAEEVAQGSLAVKWVFASSMNFTASFLRQVGQTAVSSETLLDTH